MPGTDDGAVSELSKLITELETQETELVFRRFRNVDAWDLGSSLVRLGTERGLPITVDIRRHGHQLFHVALDGTAPDNDEWINRKVRVVDRFGCSSFLVGRRLAAAGDRLDADAGVEPADYAAHGGAFPIRIVDVGVVGSVTVSGLPQEEDHALVVEAIGQFLAVGASQAD
jgi:uncharacterized protein (UPF0303 family)